MPNNASGWVGCERCKNSSSIPNARRDERNILNAKGDVQKGTKWKENSYKKIVQFRWKTINKYIDKTDRYRYYSLFIFVFCSVRSYFLQCNKFFFLAPSNRHANNKIKPKQHTHIQCRASDSYNHDKHTAGGAREEGRGQAIAGTL